MHLAPPRIGGGLQAMMHMEQGQTDAQLAGHGRRMHGQHGRIRAAADGDRDTREMRGTLGQGQQGLAQRGGQFRGHGQQRGAGMDNARPGRWGGG
ncbi:hypothetical protein G6F60_015301 [Rhizopus arrhizus]|nr:hypothetical protein G6F60_015301 [Rhizopus arrhizus]